MMPKIIMYYSERCPYCQRAEKLLKKKALKVTRIRIDSNRARLREMINRSGRDTVPQIFIADRHIGGFDELAKLEKAGTLDTLLQAPRNRSKS